MGKHIGLMMPIKGQIINLNMDGTVRKYRVLKTEGIKAEVLAMFDANSSKAFNSGYTNTYDGRKLDTYLNTFWYNGLTNVAKSAIVPKTITQYQYLYDTSVYDENKHASYADYSTKSVKASGLTRNVYALDVEDIENYFNHTFSIDDVRELFWGVRTQPSNYTCPWTRSALADDSRYAWFVSGYDDVRFDDTDYFNAARPAFTIDLSKIEWG